MAKKKAVKAKRFTDLLADMMGGTAKTIKIRRDAPLREADRMSSRK